MLQLLRGVRARVFGLGHLVQRHRPALAQPVRAQVGHHPVTPGADLRLARPPVRGDLPQAQQSLLRHILGLVTVAQHPDRMGKKPGRKLHRQQARRRSIAAGIARQQQGLRIGGGIGRKMTHRFRA